MNRNPATQAMQSGIGLCAQAKDGVILKTFGAVAALRDQEDKSTNELVVLDLTGVLLLGRARCHLRAVVFA